MTKKKKLILIILVLILGGVFLAKYTQPFKVAIVDTKTDKKSLGALNIGAIFTGVHEGYIEVDGRKYIGECTMTPTKGYEYKGNCRFGYEKSYFTCILDSALESSERKLTGVCRDESGGEYSFIQQKD